MSFSSSPAPTNRDESPRPPSPLAQAVVQTAAGAALSSRAARRAMKKPVQTAIRILQPALTAGLRAAVSVLRIRFSG